MPSKVNKLFQPAPYVRKHIPWVEKYRPDTVDEVSHQEEVVRVLKKCLESNQLPHLLFYGPPGTGKTSCIVAIAKQLFGPLYQDRVMELNASDERGIQVIREKVKHFAHLTVRKVSPEEADGCPCPPYKIIILDEADSMTPDAQAALRRIIENFTKVTRFCVICNYISRIIEPLASRCAKFRFQPVADDAHLARLRSIAQKENVNISLDGPEMQFLLKVAAGDLRRSINLLQSAHSLCLKTPITQQVLLDVAGLVPTEYVSKLLQVALDGTFNDIERNVMETSAEGYGGSQLVEQLLFEVLNESRLSQLQKSKIAEAFCVADAALTDGASEELQLLNILLHINSIFKNTLLAKQNVVPFQSRKRPYD